MEVSEYFEEAEDELKRVNHIIFVSLKYTRTVDVIRNAVQRMVDAYDFIVDGLLDYNVKEGNIRNSPNRYKAKINKLKRVYSGDDELVKYLNFYAFIRDLMKAPYEKEEEYRRNVTMISELENKTAHISIDVLEENFDGMGQDFLDYAQSLVDDE